MNNRTKTLLVLIYGLILWGLVTRSGSMLALSLPFILYLAIGMISAPDEILLQAKRDLSADRVGQDVPIHVQVEITNKGSAIRNLQISDRIPQNINIISGSSKWFTSLRSGETVSFSYTLQGKRGHYLLPGLEISASDHLSLAHKRHQVNLSDRFVILPDTFKIPELMMRPRRTRVYPGAIPARKGGSGVEFFGLREYQPGDPMRWINDRISARHHQAIFVNEFEQERAIDIGLILDCRVETNLFRDNTNLLEHSTQAAATLADYFIQAGNRVGLIIYGGGRNWIHPGYGKIQKERILHALAEARLYKNVVSKELSNLPTRLFSARSQLVLISSLLFDDMPTLIALRAHGYKLRVISPDPIQFERQFLENSPFVEQAVRLAQVEREFVIRQLRKAGILVLNWPVNQPFYQAAKFAFSRDVVSFTRMGSNHA